MTFGCDLRCRGVLQTEGARELLTLEDTEVDDEAGRSSSAVDGSASPTDLTVLTELSLASSDS